jgi:hypothetical protein
LLLISLLSLTEIAYAHHHDAEGKRLMLMNLKLAILRKGIRQTRMAVDLGWDPAKLSRIVNQIVAPTATERALIAAHLEIAEGQLFAQEEQHQLVSDLPQHPTKGDRRSRSNKNLGPGPKSGTEGKPADA